MKIICALLSLFLFIQAYAQNNCNYTGRYYDELFTGVKDSRDIVYATKATSSGRMENLMYDVYEPADDTATNRACIIMVHGGGYIDFLNQRSPDIIELSKKLVARGYVVASIEYREEANPLVLLSEEKMMKAVSRSLEDIRDAICHIMDDVNTTNTYRIDPTRVVGCGVSAGAVSLLHGAFLDSITDLPANYINWVYEVIGTDAQELLEDRYCGGNLLGIVNVSGALLEADWLANDTSVALLNIHGFQDPIVPFKTGNPFQLPTLPRLEGSYVIHEKAQELGMESYASFYNKGHVPFIDIDLADLFSGNILDIIFNDLILERTHEDIRDFCFKLINGCDNVATPVKNNTVKPIQVYPNPTTDRLNFNISALQGSSALVLFYDATGSEVLQVPLNSTNYIDVKNRLNSGIYFIQIVDEVGQVYTGRVVVQ